MSSRPATANCNSAPHKPPVSADKSSPQSEQQAADSLEPRKAQPKDIPDHGSVSKGALRYWRYHLCKYRRATNLVWASLAHAMEDCTLRSERQVYAYRAELLSKHWICYPDGDAGGRPIADKDGKTKGHLIHLHPDGKACGIYSAKTKQRTTEANQHRTEANRASVAKRKAVKSSAIPAHEKALVFFRKAEVFAGKAEELVDKAEEIDGAIGKELLIEPLKEQPSTTSAAPPDPLYALGCEGASSKQPDAAHDHHRPGIRKQCDIDQDYLRSLKIFGQVSEMCHPPVPIDGSGIKRVLAAAAKFGFNLLQWRYAVRHSGMYQTGGAIHLSENWNETTASIPTFPICFDCEDSGFLIPLVKAVPRHIPGLKDVASADRFRLRLARSRPLVCGCPRGTLAAVDAAGIEDASLENERLARWEEERKKAAHAAGANEDKQQAAAERKAKADEARAEAERQQQDFRDRHICAACEGNKGRQQFGQWHCCIKCSGSGDYWTDQELRDKQLCVSCKGVGKLHDYRERYGLTNKLPPTILLCDTCNGSGVSASAPQPEIVTP